MKKLIKTIAIATVGAALSCGAMAQDASPTSLEQLLENVKQGSATDAKEAREREAKFQREKASQATEVKNAEAERTRQQNRSVQLEKKFEDNELLISQKQSELRERLGSLSELFGHVTSAAGDARANFETSLTSAQLGSDRIAKLDALIETASSGEELPTIEQLEGLWFELQREAIESGRVVKFPATVIEPTGEQTQTNVVRIGLYNIVTEDGQYLQYISSEGALAILPRQPAGSYLSGAAALASSSSGVTAVGLDPTGPSGGSFLNALIAAPNLEERWHQGGYVGYVITAVGIFGFLLAIMRLVQLTAIDAKVRAQLKSDKANTNNPLGRVLAVHESNPNMDTETLELKLSEAVLKELPKLESGLTLLKIIAAVAPLLGLLGTVTGMIMTFQAITIFGAGDPKAMAGGISAALITTVLGLIVAIPTVLMHTIVSGRSKRIIQVLEEETTGIIAEHTEASLRSH